VAEDRVHHPALAIESVDELELADQNGGLPGEDRPEAPGLGASARHPGHEKPGEAALDLDDTAKAEEFLGIVQGARPGQVTPILRAQTARLAARLAARRGDPESAESGFLAAEQGFRRIGVPFELAVALLEHGEWLVSQGRPGEAVPFLDEGRAIFEGLQAKPWLGRLGRVSGMEGVPA
jgi:hypothetical protein